MPVPEETLPSKGAWRAFAWVVGAALSTLATVLVYESQLAWASLLFLVVCVAAIVTAPTTLGLLSWSAGIPAFYVLFFVLLPGIARMVGGDPEEPDNRVSEALYIATWGMIAFAAGTNLMRFFSGPSRHYEVGGLRRIDVGRSPWIFFLFVSMAVMASLWSYAFGYFGLIGTRGDEVGDAAGVIAAFNFLLFIAHVMAWSRYFATRDNQLLYFGLLSTLLMAALGLVANSKGQMLIPFALIALSLWGASGKFPYKLLLVVLGLYVFVAFPFVTASRFAFQAAEYTGAREQLAGTMFDYLLSREWIEDAANFGIVESLGRGLLPYFTKIVQEAGHTVSFMEGRTLAEGLEVLVPRFLYPEKPDMSVGNWTAQAFGVLEPHDYLTNISPTYMGEFFMNFGPLGVFVGMFLIGVLAVMVDRYLIVDRHTWMMPLMVSFVGWQESFIGHTIIPFIKYATVWAPILLLIAYLAGPRRHRRASGPAVTQMNGAIPP